MRWDIDSLGEKRGTLAMMVSGGRLGTVRCGIGHIGWHTFRHTFRSLLDETGAPLKVQQELMRHADSEQP
jgi:integrase